MVTYLVLISLVARIPFISRVCVPSDILGFDLFVLLAFRASFQLFLHFD